MSDSSNNEVELRLAARRKDAKEELQCGRDELETAVHEQSAASSKRETRLARELSGAQLLSDVSTTLIEDGSVDALRESIVDGAVAVMLSDFASMQMFNPKTNELELLAHRGFHSESADFWRRVKVDSPSTCGAALRGRQRVITADVERCDFLHGTGDLDAFRKSGIRAVQSTPLISRAGRFLGMLSTHWREPHEPADLEVHLFDILARQAADFIDRKQAEDALHQRTAQFETLLNNAPLGVYLVDSDYRIRHVNPTALPVFGDIADLIGRDFDEVIHLLWPKTYADEIVQRFRHTLQTGDPYIVPERIEKRADRHIIECYEWQIHRMPLPEGDYGVVCYFRDISAQVFARQTIAESEERFRAIVSQTSVGIARLDLTGKLLFINQKLAKMVGYDESELIGKAIWDLTCPADLEANRALYQRLAAEGEPYEIEYRLVRQDGALIWVKVSVAAIRDAMGKPRATVAAVIDVTERKLAEDALREADRRKDEFLAMLGHELRNPLGIISNAAHLLRRLSGSDPKLAELREMIHRQVTHTSRMLDDLLDVSRISRGKIQLLKESLDLRDVVHRTVEDYQSTADESGQRLNINMTEQPLSVIGDGTRLSQALGNLVHNACKFSERGGTVHIRLERDNDAYAVVKVRDEGMGMEPQVLEWVFEPFSQADRSLDRSRGGLGLGLSLVKGIVELHGGQVSASSQGPGRGSEFVVRLPVDRNPVMPVDPPFQENTTNHSLRILVIEDNPVAADSTRQVLQLMGHTVEVAYTGTEGVQAAMRLLPDLVLCDIGLPESDGYSVAQLLRQQVNCKKIHVIGISGYAEDADRVRAAGFEAYLTKPLDFAELGRMLEELQPDR